MRYPGECMFSLQCLFLQETLLILKYFDLRFSLIRTDYYICVTNLHLIILYIETFEIYIYIFI